MQLRLNNVVKDGIVLDADILKRTIFLNSLFFLMLLIVLLTRFIINVWIKRVGPELRLRSSMRRPSFKPTTGWIHPSL